MLSSVAFFRLVPVLLAPSAVGVKSRDYIVISVVKAGSAQERTLLMNLLKEARSAEKGLSSPPEKATALLALGKAEIAMGQSVVARDTLRRGAIAPP